MTRKQNIKTSTTSNPYVFRVPSLSKDDALSMHRIARESKVLETNTVYCYLAFVHHFGSDGCIVVERDGQVVGYVQGYRIPSERETVFVWQIGVDQSERGKGLGKHLLKQLCFRLSDDGVTHLAATVTPSNIPSRCPCFLAYFFFSSCLVHIWKLFRGFANELGVNCIESPLFKSEHFIGPARPGIKASGTSQHEAEDLFKIGPFTSRLILDAILKYPIE